VANDILKRELPDSLYRYAKFDTDTYYEYKKIIGKSHWETLNEFEKTKGKFVKVDMRWFLIIPFPNCPAIDTINVRTSFVLNNFLQPMGKPMLDLIPDVFWKNRCNLITKEQAMVLAPQKKDVKISGAYLDYDPDKKTYTWLIYYNNNELCEIDAYNGEVLSAFEKLHRMH
jgi:hypothetical protein